MNDDQHDNQPADIKPSPLANDVNNTAPLLKRIGAAIIDLFMVSFFVTPLIYHFKLDAVAEHPLAVTPEAAFKVLLCEVFVFFALNFFLLAKRGQTIGKVVFSLAIVDLNNNKPSIINLVFNRYLIQLAMIVVPFLNPADVLLMFIRRDRRCIHDLIAKTKVIDLKIPVNQTPNSFIA